MKFRADCFELDPLEAGLLADARRFYTYDDTVELHERVSRQLERAFTVEFETFDFLGGHGVSMEQMLHHPAIGLPESTYLMAFLIKLELIDCEI